jgi:hypothetical protein
MQNDQFVSLRPKTSNDKRSLQQLTQSISHKTARILLAVLVEPTTQSNDGSLNNQHDPHDRLQPARIRPHLTIVAMDSRIDQKQNDPRRSCRLVAVLAGCKHDPLIVYYKKE